jgi:hypothetical protein
MMCSDMGDYRRVEYIYAKQTIESHRLLTRHKIQERRLVTQPLRLHNAAVSSAYSIWPTTPVSVSSISGAPLYGAAM